MAHAVIEFTGTALDTGSGGSTTASFKATGFKNFTCFVERKTGVIAGLVLSFQCSPDNGVTWFDAVDGLHTAIAIGTTQYYFALNGAITDSIRIIVSSASTIASTVDVYLMADG